MLITRDPDVTSPRTLSISRGCSLTCPRIFNFPKKLTINSANLFDSTFYQNFDFKFYQGFFAYLQELGHINNFTFYLMQLC